MMPWKQDLRARCMAARRALTEEKRREKSAQISGKLAQNQVVLEAKTVLSYLAAPDEADMREFHRWAQARGKILAFPITYSGGHMEAAIPVDATAIVTGRFGIREPVRERSQIVAPEDIDVVIVPCVGFDRYGHRLGHGGGYYDRYLPRCPQAHTILVAFQEQEVEEVPAELHDMVVDEVIQA